MELGGDEKRIQALFSELSFEIAGLPRFEQLWTRGETTPARGVQAIIRLRLRPSCHRCRDFVRRGPDNQSVLNIAPLEIHTPQLSVRNAATTTRVKESCAATHCTRRIS
jgi:hypothetical protein